MKITEYSRDQIQQLVKDGLCPLQTLRDYDALKQLENGDKITHVAMDHNLTRMGLFKIRKKYLPR